MKIKRKEKRRIGIFRYGPSMTHLSLDTVGKNELTMMRFDDEDDGLGMANNKA